MNNDVHRSGKGGTKLVDELKLTILYWFEYHYYMILILRGVLQHKVHERLSATFDHVCPEVGNILILFPDIPPAIIWIPTINSAIAIMKATKATPTAGETIINMPKITSNAPTPIRNPLDHPRLSLSPNP